MLAIYKKELRSYFINPVGYVFTGIFLLISALLCCYSTLLSGSYDTGTYFLMLIFVMAVLLPLLTMRLFAEERKLKTEQLLLTAPVSLSSMVIGKFLAAMTLFGGNVLLSCVNFIPLFVVADQERAGLGYETLHIGPVFAEVLGSVIGIILLGAAFLAIGVLISSLTENQLSAAVITVAVLIFTVIMSVVNQFIDVYAVRFVIDWICVYSRFINFTYGILDFAALLYYGSIVAVFLFLTVRVYDRRRWN